MPGSLPRRKRIEYEDPHTPNSNKQLLFLVINSFLNLGPGRFPRRRLVIILQFDRGISMLPRRLTIVLLPTNFTRRNASDRTRNRRHGISRSLVERYRRPTLSQ